MREGLRSNSSKREDCKSGLGQSGGDFRRVKIPDLNLEDDQVELSPEVKGKSNGLVCEKECIDENEGNDVAVEGRGVVNESLNVECGHDIGGERNVEQEGVNGQVSDVGGSKEVCSMREGSGEEKLDDSSQNVRQDTSVGGEQRKAVVERLNCPVDSDEQVLESPSAVDNDKGVEDSKGSMVSISVERDVKKDLECNSKCIDVNGDLKTERMEEHSEVDPDMSRDMQLNSGAVIGSPEKLGVNEGVKCKFDEGDGSERLKAEASSEKVQVVARILRSRVVPASYLGEVTERTNNRASIRKRNRGSNHQGEEAILMKDENVKSEVGTESMSDSGKSQSLVQKPNNSQAIAGSEAVSSKLFRSSEKKGKRGRPKISRDHHEDVVQMNGVQTVSKVEIDGSNDNSAKSAKGTGGRGRPKKYVDCSENEKVVGDKIENEKVIADSTENDKVVADSGEKEPGVVSNKSIGRPTTSGDHPEEEVAQINVVKTCIAEEEDLSNKSVRSSKKKRGRGRPKKHANGSENEEVVADIIEHEPGDASNSSVRRLTVSRDHHEEEVAQINEVKASKVDDEGLDNSSAQSFEPEQNGRGRRRKHANCFENETAAPDKTYNVPGDVSNKSVGRPNTSRDFPEKDVAQMSEVNAVKVEDQDLNYQSARISKTKGGRGRPKKSANCIKSEKVVAEKIENTPVSVSHKSVRSLTPMRKSGRQKRSVDYSEEGAVRKRRKFSYCRIDEAMNDEKEKGLVSKVVKKSKKKGKRGRPKKEVGNGEPKMKCDDKDKVKDGRKMKVSVATAPVRRNRQDIHPHIEPEKLNNGVSSSKGIRSSKKVNFAKLEKDTVEGSKDEESPLPEKKLPVKRKRVETAGSLSSEKNLIRQQIVDMLLRAGWTIEYRPRNGREYNDAVYVNREGKTHWSVTKAYFSLLQEVEETKDGDLSFTFTPLPEEVLSKLFRVVSKTRSDKNKKKKDKGDGDTSDEEVTGDKRRKRKPSVRVGTQGRRRCALVVRRSNQGSNSDSDGAITHPGKHSVLAWMIDLGTISLDAKVHYKNSCETESVFEGSITRDGVYCCCCKEIISVSEFEVHAGSKLCRPYENIYLENGSSLLQCLLDSWNKQEEAGRLGFHGVNVDGDDPNDDTCAICGDGGDLMCCDGCPSTFHLGCLRMEDLPSGEWLCVYCSCKVCGVGGESATEGVDCDAVFSQLVACSLCEEKYHKSCTGEEDDMCAKSRTPQFCGKSCEQIFEKLESLLGTKCDLGNGFSYTLLQRSDLKPDSVTPEAQKIQDNSKLAVALAVMEECFLPIIDPRSGVNLIRHVVYSCGSNFNRLKFSSFLTVVLEKGDEIISAASIRIHGKQLAEMPFVGTRYLYRRQGMCRRLLSGIEQALSTLEIENLVIPAIPELMHTWTSVFGFKPLEEPVREEMRSMNMLVFAHTDMLQKPIVEQQFGVKNTTAIGAEKDANSGLSQNDNVDGEVDKTDANELDINNDTLNGKFDLNCVAPNVPDTLSDERGVVHPYSDAENGDEVKSRMNSGDLKDTKNDERCTNSSEVKTLHPDLNLMAENDSLSDQKSDDHGCDILKSDEVAKSTSNSSGLTNVKGCCVVECDNDQNGDSTAVTSSEERRLNPDLNLEGNDLENHDNLPSNSASMCAATGSGYPLSRSDGQTPVDLETQRNDNLLEVRQVGEIQCSDTETSKAHDVGLSNDSVSVEEEAPAKSIECSESEALLMCTRTAQLISESSCNMSSVSGENCVAGVFHGSGIAKVGPTKS